MIGDTFGWLFDPAHWRSTNFDTGIWGQLGAHVGFSLIALAIALVVALPVGLWIGHTGKATWLVTVANAVRALPTVGVLVLLVVIIAPNFYGRTNAGYLIPTEIVLVLLADPADPVQHLRRGAERLPGRARRRLRDGDDRPAGAHPGRAAQRAAADLLRLPLARRCR